MRLTVKSLLNWKFFLLAIALVAMLGFFSSHDVAHAQSDCVDPATGAACTPVPPPSCGVAGAPPCEPPPGCTAADGCTPVPPPSQPRPTKTPTSRPRPTRAFTPTPTASFTETPQATATGTEAATLPPRPSELAGVTPTAGATLPPRPTELAGATPTPRPIISGWIGSIWNNIISRNTQVTPKSQNDPWGGMVNWLTRLVNKYLPVDTGKAAQSDLFWLTKINVVDGDNYYCIGGPMCPGQNIPLYRKIKVMIMPEGIIVPKLSGGLEEDLYPVLCQGETGMQGCSDPVKGYRPSDPAAQWSMNNYFYGKYGKSLPGIFIFDVPTAWLSGSGTYKFTAYINYDQKAYLEDYSNNWTTFTVTVEGNPSIAKALPTPTPIPDNQFYFENKVVVLQNENCVQGCAVTTNGFVNVGQPVEVYLQALQILPGFQNTYSYISDPKKAAMSACKGGTGQNGCSAPLPVDSPPYSIPQWFLESPDANLLSNQPGIVRFTIPGNQIASSGLYKFTFYVNYQQQASPEKNMSDNMKVIYLNAMNTQ